MNKKRLIAPAITMSAACAVAAVAGLPGSHSAATSQVKTRVVENAAADAAAPPAGSVDVTNSPTGADAPLRALVMQALRRHQKLGLVPGALHGKPADPQALHQQVAADSAAISGLYELGKAGKEQAALKRSEVLQGGGIFHLLGGDVDNVTFVHEYLSDSSASVDVTADTWSRFEQKVPDGTWQVSEPHNTVQWHFDLVKKTGNSWAVAGDDFQFAPGSQP